MSATLLKMLEIRKRRLPHWTITGSYYYITFRLQTGCLTDKEILIVKDHIKAGHLKFYLLIAVQVMPDHVHLILKPNDDITLARIMKGIKGVSARLINQSRGSSGTIWMQEYFDRIIRTQSDLDEKLKYMYENPVRCGLTDEPDKYIGWYFQEQ